MLLLVVSIVTAVVPHVRYFPVESEKELKLENRKTFELRQASTGK